MSLVQEGASLRTGACNRAEHQRQRWHDPLRLSFPFPQPTHRELLKELPTAWGAGDCDQQRVPERGSAPGRAGAAALRSCTMWVLDTFFYHAENITEEVIEEVEEWLGQPVGTLRRELGFHPAQTDRRQLLYRLPSKAPSSTNQIARCSFAKTHPPFF